MESGNLSGWKIVGSLPNLDAFKVGSREDYINSFTLECD
jgi:hypothetical protein